MDMKTIQELTATTSSSMTNIYRQEWVSEAVEGTKKSHSFVDKAVGSLELETAQGSESRWIDYQLADITSWTTQTSEATTIGDTEMLGIYGGVEVKPVCGRRRIDIDENLLATSVLDLATKARDQLIYGFLNTLDVDLATKLAAATDATNSAKGAQTIFGGDAYSDATLTAGDVMTPDLIAMAASRLGSSVCKYWSGSSELNSSAVKFPYKRNVSKPILFISTAAEEALQMNSAFVNASEFGSDHVIQNGLIAHYLGVDIVTADNTPAYTNWGGSTLCGHKCLMVVPGKAIALVWRFNGRPNIEMTPFPREGVFDFILKFSYKAQVINADAVVKIDVADALV